MDAYWSTVWQIGGLLTIVGVCLAAGGALVAGGWIGIRNAVNRLDAADGASSPARIPTSHRLRAVAAQRVSAAPVARVR